MKLKPIVAGLAGAISVTLLNEIVRRKDKDAPRLDKLGTDTAKRLLKKAGQDVPSYGKLFYATMVSDIITNGLYYAFTDGKTPKSIWTRGALLGLAAGAGSVIVPRQLNLSPETTGRTTKTKVMSVTWYLIGGLVSAAALSLLESKPNKKEL